MTRQTKTDIVNERVGLWKQAFDAIREETTQPEMRLILATLQSTEEMRSLPIYVQLARLVSANDRCAATVAALITANGIKTPPTFDYGDDA
jgi:hypothetical protein